MLTILFAAAGFAQPTIKASDLEGSWKGSLIINRPDRAKPTEVEMRLNIVPLTGVKGYHYQLVYPKQAPRNYKLLPVDEEKGHWQIDEQNGIKLDAFWTGSGFTSCFSVGGNLLISSEKLEGKRLIWTCEIFEEKILANTGGINGGPAVLTRRLISTQKAEMTRTAAKIEPSARS